MYTSAGVNNVCTVGTFSEGCSKFKYEEMQVVKPIDIPCGVGERHCCSMIP